MAASDNDRPMEDLEPLVEGVMAGDRRQLARAITLIESRRPEDATLGQELLTRLLGLTGNAVRIGISGIPGVGKSTLIDSLGKLLVERGYKVAVLAVDPSSTISGGSILGDKSRMPQLAADERAFIRPSPTARSLGGVARRTQEALLLCEAAGYDVVLVETVGVGQSEIEVSEMVDSFVVLLLPGAGDELQGIKKGILELADVIAINKADGDLANEARRTSNEYASALRYLGGSSVEGGAWETEVLALSAHTGENLEALWSVIERHRAHLEASGRLDERRREQRGQWLWRLVEEGVMSAFRADGGVRTKLAEIEGRVRNGDMTAAGAAELLLASYFAEPN